MESGLKPLGREKFWLFLLLLPTLFGLLFGSFGSLFATIGISFTKWDLLTPPKWDGINNYIEAFQNEAFLKALRNTLTFSGIYVPSVLVISLIVALFLNRKLRGVSIFRTAFFLPSVTSAVAVSLMFQWLYAKDDGLINIALGKFGVSPINWLGADWVMLAVIIANVWGAVGEGMIIFLSGLQAVPREYYEAAEVDGASTWKKFWGITLPLITPSIFFQLLITTINAFQAFEYIYMLTRIGNGDSRIPVVVFSIYRNAFFWFNMGGASAQALILSVIIIVLMTFYLWAERRWVVYE
jgi:multiple sugar transport system permease protein